eukprot:GHVU01154076.1.p1 GENE.GHVU01154076.1~~GHVU01154076.1.p1  ORF type:complete len:155 (-),score=1.92 GHVU01154076.1:92-556(-)
MSYTQYTFNKNVINKNVIVKIVFHIAKYCYGVSSALQKFSHHCSSPQWATKCTKSIPIASYHDGYNKLFLSSGNSTVSSWRISAEALLSHWIKVSLTGAFIRCGVLLQRRWRLAATGLEIATRDVIFLPGLFICDLHRFTAFHHLYLHYWRRFY